MKAILEDLFAGAVLSTEQARLALLELTSNKLPAAQVAAFLTVFRMRRPATAEILGFRRALIELALPLPITGYKAIDLCGTGGDGKDTFNISTVTAFVVAGAGFPVIKHGNYGASSRCGSSNVLEALNVPFPASPGEVHKMLDRAGIAFLHAPLWHPALKSVAPLRKELAFRTIFNTLAPLVNPADPPYQLVGVFNRDTLELYASVLKQLDRRFAAVFTEDGHDEISLTDRAVMIGNEGQKSLHAADFGFSVKSPAELAQGATVSEAAKICLDILRNEGTKAQQEAVLANAALALSLLNPQMTLLDCVGLAHESLQSLRAWKAFNALQEMKR